MEETEAMNDATHDPRLGIGGNNPPITEDELRAELQARHANFDARYEELNGAAATVPARIADEDTAGKLQDLLKQIRTETDAIEASRVTEKKKWSTLADCAHAFFKRKDDQFAKLAAVLKPRLTKYLQDKRDAEERARREAAERERREAERKRAEALAAEEKRLAAERKAREEREKAERAKAEGDAKAARDARLRAQAAERSAEAATVHADVASEQAAKSDARAERIEDRLATATDADLSRTRGERGTVGSLTGSWQMRVVDREKIPLALLRGYLNPDHVDVAIRRYMRDNKLENQIAPLDGVEFYWQPDSRVA
jgi:hypothetical protein